MSDDEYTRIEFRRLAEVDPADLIELMNDPAVRRHMPLARGCFGRTECQRFLAAKERMWEVSGFGPWAFVLGDEFVGWGGLQPEGDDADVGLVLRRKYWGAGRVLYRRILDHAFNELGLDSVIALLPLSRTRVAALRRLGFRDDGETVIGHERFNRYRLSRSEVDIGWVALRPFPTESRMCWCRIDVPGREEARIERTTTGWRLTGELDVEETGLTAHLRYVIECDPEWHTRSAIIEGEAAGRPIRIELAADGLGNWSRDGAAVPDLSGALDVDLGFTPATNTLPIRRLGLGVGEGASVFSAWLRFPELRLEPLAQTYTREGELTFRYRALVDGEPFVARLDTDVFGRVIHYEGLWDAELAEP